MRSREHEHCLNSGGGRGAALVLNLYVNKNNQHKLAKVCLFLQKETDGSE